MRTISIQYFRKTSTALLMLAASIAHSEELTVLTYHDIAANPGDDAYAISRSAFVEQMDYLEQNGYQPISLEQLNRIYKKQEKLPKKAVLLTFDDGLKSYYRFAVPVLKTYGFPSILSVVSGWADNKNTPPEYRGKLLNWDQLRELQKSKYVEIISHTHELHTNVQSNPQGNYAPAGVTRIFSPTIKQYETERVFRQRIAQDLKNSKARFKKELGIEPKGIAWPYGKYDNVMATEARLLGMNFQLTLNDGPNYPSNFPVLNRIMIMRDTGINDFISDLKYEPTRNYTHRFAELSLDAFAGQDAQSTEKLMSELLDEVERLDVNTVILSPMTKDGAKSFFPTRELSTAADILNRVTHQLNSRLGIRHIFLHLSDHVSLTKSETVLNDMARLAWFNGVVFDGVNNSDMNKIRKIVEYYHPKSSFGYYRDPRPAKAKTVDTYDFVILPVNADNSNDEIRNKILKATGAPIKLFVQVKVDEGDESMLPRVFDMIKNLGIKHYGVAHAEGLLSYADDYEGKYTRVSGMANGTLAVFGG